MRKEPSPPSQLPRKREDMSTSDESGLNPVSRREFIRAGAAAGIASAGIASMTPPAAASVQENRGPSSQNSLPTTESFYMYEGTAAGALLEQLRAAGIRMLFHTNTSGFVPLWEAHLCCG